MIIKSYFDGGNKPDSRIYDNVTLASLSGDTAQWRQFEREWVAVLRKHSCASLHTTDALALQGDFREWNYDQINALITALSELLIERCSHQEGSRIKRMGIRPCAIKVDLKAFVRFQSESPDYPAVTEICAVQALAYVNWWWQSRKGHFLYLYFDRSEPFRGHIIDRLNNPKAIREFPASQRIKHCGELAARDAPALQAADLLAWSVGHSNDVRSEWHKKILEIPRDGDDFDYEKLKTQDAEAVKIVQNYKLPKRKPIK